MYTVQVYIYGAYNDMLYFCIISCSLYLIYFFIYLGDEDINIDFVMLYLLKCG